MSKPTDATPSQAYEQCGKTEGKIVLVEIATKREVRRAWLHALCEPLFLETLTR